MNSIPTRLGADVNQRIALASGRPLENPILPRNSQAEHIDQRVSVVHLLEIDLPAHRRNADTVAVARDARHHALKERPVFGELKGTETKGVQDSDRPRPHGEDVPQDAAHPRGRTLVRLDEGGVVVALDLEDGGEPLADVHGPRVLTGTLHHPFRLRGQLS